jgi:ribonuclease HI
MPKQKYYVVWKGRKTGIFPTWESCSSQVKGFVDAEYKAFESRADAEAAFRASYSDYKGRRTPSPGILALEGIGRPLPDSYCVDASCLGNPGWMEYRCVHTTTRKKLFQRGPFQHGTNNVGEFLAIVEALAVLTRKGSAHPVYSDSANAISWVRKKKCRTRLVRDKASQDVFDLIARAESWLHENDYKNPVLKWDTAAWGEIPADYGRK